MGMTRAEAEAVLAAQGYRNPSRSYQGTTATDVLQAARPDQSLGWINLAGQAAGRLTPSKSSAQDRLMEAYTQMIEKQAGIAPKAKEPGFLESIFGGDSGKTAGAGTAGVGTAGVGASQALGSGSAGAGITTASEMGLSPASWMGGASTPGAGSVLPSAGTGTVLAPTLDGIAGTGIGGSAGVALPAAGILAGAATGALQGKGIYDAAKGKRMNFASQAALALPTFGASFLYNPARKMFGSRKGAEQTSRDQYRSQLKDSGFVDSNYDYTMSDGSKFNFGLDGKKNNYNVDFSRNGIGDVVAGANPLALLYTQNAGKQRSDLAGQLTNAAASSGDAKTNLIKQYTDSGFNHDSAYGQIHALQQSGKISQEAGDQAKNALDQLYGVGAYAKGGKAYVSPTPSIQNADKSRWK